MTNSFIVSIKNIYCIINKLLIIYNLAIVGINSVIYLCWKSKRFHPLMIKHFLSSPSTGKPT